MKTKNFLMCEPHFFGVDYVINPWMNGKIGTVNRELASEQFASLVSKIYELGSAAIFMDPEEGLPDQVFTANAGLIVKNLKHGGSHKAIVSKFANPERQGEEANFLKAFSQLQLPCLTTPEDKKFEGAGDALYALDNLLFMGYGFRTDRSFVDYAYMLLAEYGIIVKPLRLVNPNFYHLDTCFCPLDNGHVMLYRDAFDEVSFESIVDSYGLDEILCVNKETADAFGCNAISIGTDIIVNDMSKEDENKLNERGYKIHRVPLTEFMKAGGSAKCLTLEIS